MANPILTSIQQVQEEYGDRVTVSFKMIFSVEDYFDCTRFYNRYQSRLTHGIHIWPDFFRNVHQVDADNIPMSLAVFLLDSLEQHVTEFTMEAYLW